MKGKELNNAEALRHLLAGKQVTDNEEGGFFLSAINNLDFACVLYEWIEPPKDIMTESEVFAFIFKYRGTILLRFHNANACSAITSFDDNSLRVKMDGSWYSIHEVLEQAKYTLSTDIEHLEWHGWEK